MSEQVGTSKKRKPAINRKQRENYLVNLALDFVEEKLKNGTATSQEVVHFLRLATERERLENKRIESDLKVAEAKIKQIALAETTIELYENAIKAMNAYKGNSNEVSEDDIYDG